MGDKSQGVVRKYEVKRVDGRSVNWCFVLEDTDPLAPFALEAYADAAERHGYIPLASELRMAANQIKCEVTAKATRPT